MMYHHLLEKYLVQLVVQKFLVMLELPNLLECCQQLVELQQLIIQHHFVLENVVKNNRFIT
jgi:hypothetical protein